MDHVPIPRDPLHPQIRVRYLRGGSPYDFLGFKDFPTRQGWSFEDIADANFDTHPEDETCFFLQTWLFFGLLADVLTIPLDTKDFVSRTPSEEEFITTEKLPEYLVAWRDSNQLLDTDARRMAFLRAHDVLEFAAYFVQRLCAASSPLHDRCPLSPEIRLSIMVLGTTLNSAINTVFHIPFDEKHGLVADAHLFWGSSQLLLSRMLQDGWCPCETSKMGVMNTASHLYLSNLRLSSSEDHSNCSGHTCVAYQVDETSYKTTHVSDDCACSHVGPAIKSVLSVLEQGDIPIIRMRPQNSSLDFQVLRYMPSISYVAISHVWSHGMGNPNSNTIPACRAHDLYQKLRPYFRAAGDEVRFWLDTLCVPLWPDYGIHRNLALGRMKETYADAERVLVLDAQLLQTTSELEWEEALLRITHSGWMRRLWTLHEASLARLLDFQFKDGTIHFDDLLNQYVRDYRKADLIRPLLWVDATHFITQLHYLKKSKGATKMQYMWNCIQWRSTSKASDEALCLAMQLDLDVKAIVSAPPPEKMKTLYALQKHLPASILFADYPRLTEPGFRWAPASFLGPKVHGDASEQYALILGDGSIAEWREPGLKITSPGFRLHSLKEPELHPITWFTDNRSGKLVRFEWYGRYDTIDERFNPAGKRLAIVLKKERYSTQTGDGALVSIFAEKNDVIFAIFICSGSVKEESDHGLLSSRQKLKSCLALQQIEEENMDLGPEGVGEFLGGSQEWCIT